MPLPGRAWFGDSGDPATGQGVSHRDPGSRLPDGLVATFRIQSDETRGLKASSYVLGLLRQVTPTPSRAGGVDPEDASEPSTDDGPAADSSAPEISKPNGYAQINRRDANLGAMVPYETSDKLPDVARLVAWGVSIPWTQLPGCRLAGCHRRRWAGAGGVALTEPSDDRADDTNPGRLPPTPPVWSAAGRHLILLC